MGFITVQPVNPAKSVSPDTCIRWVRLPLSKIKRGAKGTSFVLEQDTGVDEIMVATNF